MTEIDVADDKGMNNLKVVEPAFIGLAKESIRLIYLAAGSVLGIFMGFGVAFLLGIIDYKIYDVRSAEEATGLTCMAAIPASSKFGRQDKWQSILTHDPHTANAEAVRNLRASVILLGKQERNKVLLVTSSIPGEGKTTVSAELAAAFALNKERTLLIDLDLRRPKLTESFPHLKGTPGIVEVLAGQATMAEVLHESDIPNLTVVGSGNKAPNPSELLHEGEFNSLLENLIPQFDRIILDSAPVLPVADSRLLAKHAHAVILVVRTRKTPIGAMIRACDLLKASGAKLGGVVVNGMKRSGGSNYLGYKGLGEYGGEEYGYYGGDK
jgi:capsular exopolysaccharide synthesis family protein